MRVLLYNWVDCQDDRGGGVTAYLRNLLAEMDQDPELDPAFLSSGMSYDLRRQAPRWKRVPSDAGPSRYEIINSGVVSPSHYSFGDPAQLSHPPTRDAFFDFVEQTGPYDVIHFHNLEGLPADVLSLKARWPGTRVILTLHNYYPFCPQVNLWHQERSLCRDYEDGARCATCLPRRWEPQLVRRIYAGAPWMMRTDSTGSSAGAARLTRQLAKAARRVLPARPARELTVTDSAAAEGFAARRAGIVDLINQGCDHVLCVSDRTRQIAQRYGIVPGILCTSYIGTPDADKFLQTRPKLRPFSERKTLTLGFFGYMRPDKGGPFLLEILAQLPPDIAARIRLLVAARLRTPSDQALLDRLRSRLAGVVHHKGYDRGDLDRLMRDVDIGVVPVLWEDNLPQVAIEMHARHIPLLTSDRGGAQELANCPDMIFPAGDSAAFIERLRTVLAGGIDLEAYWRGARAPQTFQAHISELKRLYSGENCPDEGRYGATNELSCQSTDRSGS